MKHVFTIFIIVALSCFLEESTARITCPHHDKVYPILLDNCGPEPKPLPPVHEPPIVLPTHHEPMKVLPIPPICPPKVLSHKIVHYQTILRPKVFQRVITVPRLVHYLKKRVKPVIEHIPYHAKPILPCEEEAPPVNPILQKILMARQRRMNKLRPTGICHKISC